MTRMMDAPELKPEVDFRDLLRKPAKLFGLGYIYFIVALVVLGILYLMNLNTVGRNSVEPAALQDSSALTQDIPLVMPAVLPPIDVQKAAIASPEAISRGKELFQGNCAACHGETGHGDGPTSATLNPKPRNFLSLDGWKNGSKVSQIYTTLQEGIPGSAMSSYSYMPPADRFALAHYIRTLAPGQPADSPDDLQKLEAAYQLSKGMNRPGQIPIRRAARIYIAEHTADVQLAARLRREIEAEKQDRGAALLRSSASDLGRAVTSLVLHSRQFTGSDDFIAVVSGNPRLFGLRPTINDLPPEDWQAVFAYVNRLKKETS